MKDERPAQELLKSKPHFEILDGLRGVAALAVVVFHFMEMVYSDYSQNFIAHGFLAVDFFFCLSGFVIGYAYDDRIRNIGLGTFFKSRLIRLHPLVILGSVLGLVSFYLDPFGGHPELYSAGKILLIFTCSIFLIPFPVMEDRAFNLFGLNPPTWTLFWEYVANLIYAVVLYKASRRILILITLIAAIAICCVVHRAGDLMGGWGGPNFWDGLARISFSFSMGLLIYRSNWMIRNRLGFPGLSILLAVAFLVPYSRWNWLTEPLIVIFYFPLIIMLGAGATLRPALKKFCLLSGNISYPLYMTHYVILWMFAHYFARYKPSISQTGFLIVGSICMLLLLAYGVMRFYDVPLRKMLKKTWL